MCFSCPFSVRVIAYSDLYLTMMMMMMIDILVLYFSFCEIFSFLRSCLNFLIKPLQPLVSITSTYGCRTLNQRQVCHSTQPPVRCVSSSRVEKCGQSDLHTVSSESSTIQIRHHNVFAYTSSHLSFGSSGFHK